MDSNMKCAGRWLIALLFIVSGAGMLMNFSGTAAWLASMGVPMASLALVVILLIKIPGAVVYALGKKYSNYAGFALIGFTVIATLMAHMNWADQMQMTMALKNLAIIGGLLATTACVCGGTCIMCKTCEVKK